jgi:hypothetical protein
MRQNPLRRSEYPQNQPYGGHDSEEYEKTCLSTGSCDLNAGASERADPTASQIAKQSLAGAVINLPRHIDRSIFMVNRDKFSKYALVLSHGHRRTK